MYTGKTFSGVSINILNDSLHFFNSVPQMFPKADDLFKLTVVFWIYFYKWTMVLGNNQGNS